MESSVIKRSSKTDTINIINYPNNESSLNIKHNSENMIDDDYSDVNEKHDNGVKYNCKQCEYVSTQKKKLQQHMQSVHNGVKYSCEHCDYKAAQKNNLLKHMKSIHSGV